MVIIPFFCHHENTLDQQAFQDLWTDALEEAEKPFVFDDKLHHLDEAFEVLPLALRRRLGLQADLGYNKRLGRDGSQCLGHSTEY